ncbi:hypothetical protein RIR_jg41954.t1 [Rhizophagus irregularis DAOM 181602=DAOM 197198]|uniref:Uncharacterized protein n=1 Tax=Rhizophagus irregularis (strain DAOM 181602 / DAOM 197198 / MUCL 43194) TaxID=747089 RepID=U9TGC4_RHIID|nr:hypothetical protein RIR_jg41954.t1 [Rhizophagus irregularis DAOM 181602=DAOM 197198]
MKSENFEIMGCVFSNIELHIINRIYIETKISRLRQSSSGDRNEPDRFSIAGSYWDNLSLECNKCEISVARSEHYTFNVKIPTIIKGVRLGIWSDFILRRKFLLDFRAVGHMTVIRNLTNFLEYLPIKKAIISL